MSQSDSFIDEVTEEVRRDRVFAFIRRWGWVAVLAVLVLVGGAAWNEWRKAQRIARAEALGDAILSALAQDDPAARAAALEGVDAGTPTGAAVLNMLRAGALVAADDDAAAAAQLDAVASDGALPPIYRDIAGFKAVLVGAETLPAEERRLRLEAMAVPGAPLRLLAEEQLALMDIAADDRPAALARLGRILEDADVTAGLRQRASQLIVALGGTLPERQQG